MVKYDLNFLWKRYYPYYLFLPLYILFIIGLPLIGKGELGYNLTEILFFLTILWELTWIVFFSKNFIVFFSCILRIISQLSLFTFHYLILNPIYKNLIFLPTIEEIRFEIVVINLIIFALSVFLINLINQKYDTQLKYYSKTGLISWRSLEN